MGVPTGAETLVRGVGPGRVPGKTDSGFFPSEGHLLDNGTLKRHQAEMAATVEVASAREQPTLSFACLLS